MSDEILAPLIALGILAVLFLWVPTLDICNDRCKRLLLWRKKSRPETRDTSNGTMPNAMYFNQRTPAP